MYKQISINGKDYKLEYSIEASLYSDCVSTIAGMLADAAIAEKEQDVKKLVEGMANIPQTSLTIFYAGLIEHHGNYPNGDGTVPDIQTAKSLIAQFMKEHKEDEYGNFYGVMQMCVEQMGEDGFFDLVGLNAMVETKPKKQRKTPQDHQKKATDK